MALAQEDIRQEIAELERKLSALKAYLGEAQEAVDEALDAAIERMPYRPSRKQAAPIEREIKRRGPNKKARKDMHTRQPHLCGNCRKPGHTYKTCKELQRPDDLSGGNDKARDLNEREEAWRKFEPAISMRQYSDLKEMSIEREMSPLDIADELDIPLESINRALPAKNYEGYKVAERKAALG